MFLIFYVSHNILVNRAFYFMIGAQWMIYAEIQSNLWKNELFVSV